jgi:hypothetical protein
MSERVIEKYMLTRDNSPVTYSMPRSANILHVDTWGEVPCFWAMEDPTEDEIDRTFLVVCGTAKLIDTGPLEHIGTTREPDSPNVWHVFEVLNTPHAVARKLAPLL